MLYFDDLGFSKIGEWFEGSVYHENAIMLIFSHLLTKVFMGNWTTLSVVLVTLYDALNDSGS